MPELHFTDWIWMLVVYAVVFTPQLNLVNKVYDQHIGNLVVHRISGKSLLEVASYWYFYAIPAVALSAFVPLFREKARRYKLVHVAIVSLIFPLMYVFMLRLTGSASCALAGALIGAVFFNLPIALNYLANPEQYEILLFFGGGILALAGLDGGSPGLLCAGAAVLGCGALCKFPPLATVAMMVHVGLALFGRDRGLAGLAVAAYCCPVLLFSVVRAIGRRSQTVARSSYSIVGTFVALCSEVPRRLKGLGIRDIVNPTYTHLLENLATGFLTSVLYALNTTRDLAFFNVYLAVTALGFLARLEICNNYSFMLGLCMTAGLGLAQILEMPSYSLLVMFAVLVLVVAMRVSIYAPRHWVFTFRPEPFAADAEDMAGHIRETSPEDAGLFVNVRGPASYMHLLSQRTMGPILPMLEWSRKSRTIHEIPLLLETFRRHRPLFMLVKTDEPQILDVTYLEEVTGTHAIPALLRGVFLLYELRPAPGRAACHGETVDLERLTTPDPARIRADAQRLADAATGGSPCAA